MALTKSILVEKIAESNGFLKNQALDVTESLIEVIKSTLASGEDVMVSGFGKFQVKDKASRKGRNPATGETLILDAHRVVTFKCSQKLREKINRGGKRPASVARKA
jgi:integration host factor subunit alpha